MIVIYKTLLWNGYWFYFDAKSSFYWIECPAVYVVHDIAYVSQGCGELGLDQYVALTHSQTVCLALCVNPLFSLPNNMCCLASIYSTVSNTSSSSKMLVIIYMVHDSTRLNPNFLHVSYKWDSYNMSKQGFFHVGVFYESNIGTPSQMIWRLSSSLILRASAAATTDEIPLSPLCLFIDLLTVYFNFESKNVVMVPFVSGEPPCFQAQHISSCYNWKVQWNSQ